jgi:hypothetical protein
MSTVQVAAHFGRKSKMFVERWLRREGLGFPRPVRIGGQRYWRQPSNPGKKRKYTPPKPIAPALDASRRHPGLRRAPEGADL